jgi:8-oxo-dGTP pyrophosphatase MutT (NUDIX family)
MSRPVRRVSLSERPDLVRPIPGRRAAVAVPVVAHPRWGESLVVTRRAQINGHTGARMTNAGDIVLFGGSIGPGETAAQAALRELGEESGTSSLLGEVRLGQHLGTWVTEAGFHVDGFAVALPDRFVALARPEPREVAEVAYLPTSEVRAAAVRSTYHRVDPRDHRIGPEAVAFESPTIRVRHPGTGASWVLWGLAGFMVDRWRVRSR